MRLVSVNVGEPTEVSWRGVKVQTGIYKKPVGVPVRLRPHNLDGDRQADLAAHGGPKKALYAYSWEHYDYWQAELPGAELCWGAFGENLTTEGMLEDAVSIGDRFCIGSAVVQVTQPRMPCYKLGIRFGRDDMVERFLASGRTGFYLSVVEEGELKAGDAVELIGREKNGITVAELFGLYLTDAGDRELLRRAMAMPWLPSRWRKDFARRLGEG